MPPDSVSPLLRALAHERRRHVVSHLAGSGTATHEELVAAVVEREDAASSRSRERVATALRHVHLPTLADADLVEVDGEAGEVRLEPEVASGVSDLLAVAESVTRRAG